MKIPALLSTENSCFEIHATLIQSLLDITRIALHSACSQASPKFPFWENFVERKIGARTTTIQVHRNHCGDAVRLVKRCVKSRKQKSQGWAQALSPVNFLACLEV